MLSAQAEAAAQGDHYITAWGQLGRCFGLATTKRRLLARLVSTILLLVYFIFIF